MPAPSLATLFDFETQYESALASHLANVNASWQILTPQTRANIAGETDILRTPRIMLSLAVSGPGEQREFVNSVGYYADFSGTMTVHVATQRDDVTQNHGLMRGTVRQAMLETTAVFNANTVPYLQTVDIFGGASSQGSDQENQEIVTILTFPMKFFVPPASFP